jgi:hypothetical protein
MMPRHAVLVTALLLAGAARLEAQRAATSVSLYIENDTFTSSDTGYTNGIRLSWAILRFRPGMRFFTDYNLATAVDGGLAWLGLDRLRLDRLGLIPDMQGDVECDENPERADRAAGACTILTFGIAQTMFTPDSLATTELQARDQPYAGFLYATIGVTTLDSPVQRSPRHWLAFTEVTNVVLIGVTGQAAHAEDTQSLAHWTWATGSHRPLGWNNQLRQAIQVGLITDISARPRRWEYCRKGCSGIIDERRRLDLTSHTEAVASTHMVRLSQGLTARAGMDFPDVVGALRIPVSAPQGAGPDRGLVILNERYWWYVFGNAEARYVPYNMFLAGGLADGGPHGWRTLREITPRRGVMEVGYGLAVGSSRMSMRGQLAFRTPEYDVIGARRSHGLHGFGSIMLSITSSARANR